VRLLLTIQGPKGPLHYTDGISIALTDRETGETYRYAPGLQVSDGALLQSMSFMSTDAGARRLPLTVVAPGAVTLAGRAELSRLLDDTDDRADREIVAAGVLTEIVVDVHRWSAIIEEDTSDDRGALLDERAAVDPTTWPRTDAQRTADGDPVFVGSSPGFDPRIIGVPYPVAIGYPGTLQAAFSPIGGIYQAATIAGPGLLAEVASTPASGNISDTRVIVSDDWVNASHVHHTSTDATTGLKRTDRREVIHIHDTRGRRVSAVRGMYVVEMDGEHWIAWDSADGGGIDDPYTTAPVLRRMDSVIRWALDRSTLRVDRSMLHHLSAFRGLQVDTVLTAQSRPWEWLTSQVLPLLPVSVVHGPRGLYLWPWVPALSNLDCSHELQVGRNCDRLDAWQLVPLPGVSRVTVAYCLDARSGALANRWTLAARRLPTDDPATVGLDPWARRTGVNRTGREVAIDAPIICDAATAQHIARMQVQVACRPQYLAQIVAARDDDLLPGSLVRVIDSGMAVDAVAQVEAVRYTGDARAIYDVRAWAGVGKE
jgi:hypothetical protein